MTLALPTTRDEDWRWSDLSALPALADAAANGGAVVPRWIGEGPRLLFVDGRYDEAASDPGPVTIGAIDAATDHPLGRLATGAGWTLSLDKDGFGGTIEIVHIAIGGANHVPARIMLAEDATASIVESYIGDGWANRLTRIDLARSARLMRAIRIDQASGFTSLRDEATLAGGASLVTTILGAGEGGTRIDAHIALDGSGAFAEHGGALLARDAQRHDAAIVVRHAAAEGTSRQLWRAVADDKATTSMAARVEVARDAQKTEGEQSLRGLMLKRTATVNLKPELEIFADDVKCAHGATVGELDKRALFYMESRGVTPDRAKALLTHAFIADALDRIGDAPAREAFLADADRWLEARA
ncbi:SufD family Fe-S cluster assembly protein [Sphingomonas montanisoli]|uniref:SufD family Fe-S cluster assembly protein n=1 Tax=Sphingomonas montanisoli TaxID=2606412 RepID=A0A5D9C451_9SPHN|nr:SufD family Fe-S cluster assembly protein [Sphingomonas montanisoli]TZG26459.1 SufD family Fe-S cluster assembly protein [Sphingomonas montanisoli]